jgi:hypothetical protein
MPYYRCQALIAHRDKLDPILEACETFGRASKDDIPMSDSLSPDLLQKMHAYW